MSEIENCRIEARRKRRDDLPSFLIAVGAVGLGLAYMVIASDPYADLADRVADTRPTAVTAAAPLPEGWTAYADANVHDRLAALP